MKIFFLVLTFIFLFPLSLAFAHPEHEPEDVLFHQGLEAFDQRNFEKAMALFDTILEHNPNNVDALNKKGSILNMQKNFVEAQPYFDRALEIEPSFLEALNNKGKSLFGQGHKKQAIKYFDKALEINPDYVDALINKSTSLIELRKYHDAFTPLNNVMRIDPGNEKATAYLLFIKFRLDYISVDGFMEIQVYNSQGFLVTHFVTRDLYILNNTITENAINAFPVKKIFNRDGQEYEFLQKRGVINEKEGSTPGRTGFSFGYNTEVMLAYATHYQFVVEAGDVVVYYTNIFRPVE